MISSLRFYTVLLKKLHLILSKLGKFRGGGRFFWPTLYMHVGVLAKFIVVDGIPAVTWLCWFVIGLRNLPAMLPRTRHYVTFCLHREQTLSCVARNAPASCSGLVKSQCKLMFGWGLRKRTSAPNVAQEKCRKLLYYCFTALLRPYYIFTTILFWLI